MTLSGKLVQVAGPDPVPDGLPLPFGQGEQYVEHEAGRGAAVSGIQALRKGADVNAMGVQLLDGPEPLREVTRQPVQPRDHDDVAGPGLGPGQFNELGPGAGHREEAAPQAGR